MKGEIKAYILVKVIISYDARNAEKLWLKFNFLQNNFNLLNRLDIDALRGVYHRQNIRLELPESNLCEHVLCLESEQNLFRSWFMKLSSIIKCVSSTNEYI